MGAQRVKSVRLSSALLAVLLALGLACAAIPAQAAQTCPSDSHAPVRTPAVKLDTRGDGGGARYGTMQYRHGAALAPGEIALTFDDGPDPETTPRVLDILDRHCIKAAFFMVGYYAQKRPDLVREIAARGHTIGTHTWLHPNNLRRLSPAEARREITRGFEAVEAALAAAPPADRERLAPFFRFPGLNDSPALIAWLGERHVATVSCDAGADDWLRIGAGEVYARALRNIETAGRGILILHDTKPHTADMLSALILEFERRGYRFVQLTPQDGARALAERAPGALIGSTRNISARTEHPRAVQ